MLGVIANNQEKNLAEEFFELFKIPWEFYEAGRAYDVVISTSQDNVSELNSKFIIIYSSGILQTDSATQDIPPYSQSFSMLEANGVE